MTLSDEDIERLRRGHEQRTAPSQPRNSRESICPRCGRHITETKSVGEAGHGRSCPLREERYDDAASIKDYTTEGSA